MAERRGEVQALVESIDLPEGYNQRPEIEMDDPNLNSFTRQGGAATVLFEPTSEDVAQIRDDLHESLVSAGFIFTDRAPRCDETEVKLRYNHPNIGVGSTTAKFESGRSVYTVYVQVGWDVRDISEEVLVAPVDPLPLPVCPGE